MGFCIHCSSVIDKVAITSEYVKDHVFELQQFILVQCIDWYALLISGHCHFREVEIRGNV